MATAGDDFEKGADDGTERILSLVAAIASRCGRGTVREDCSER
jgi:hypothetical protein